MTNQAARNRIMSELLDQYPGLAKPGKKYVDWANDPANPLLDSRKTLSMRMIESHFGQPITEILSMDKKGVELARYLTVSTATIARWRQRLGLTRPYKRKD